jgi:hypothetical protein
MKTMLFAAATVLSLGIGSAYANEGGSQSGGYVYPDYQFPTQSVPSVATAPSGQAIHAYVANSSLGTWLFPPNQTSDGTNG